MANELEDALKSTGFDPSTMIESEVKVSVLASDDATIVTSIYYGVLTSASCRRIVITKGTMHGGGDQVEYVASFLLGITGKVSIEVMSERVKIEDAQEVLF